MEGCPDFVFAAVRVVAFLDGDFWHGRSILRGEGLPKSNRQFWIAKLKQNRDRDSRVSRRLRKEGWRVIRIWTSDLARAPERVLDRLLRVLREPRRVS